MKKVFLFFAVALLTAQVARSQAPNIINGFSNGVGIGLPAGTNNNFSDASLHIKADDNPYLLSGNAQTLLFCETNKAPGDNLRLMNAKGGTGNSFQPWLFGTVTTDPTLAGIHLGANISSANDVVNTNPAMLFSVMRDYRPRSFQENPSIAGTAIVNRPLFRWSNLGTPLMTMYPTTAANGDARMAFGNALPAVLPTYKFELITPGGGATAPSAFNDGLRITNTGGASSMLRLKAASAGGREWAIHSSGAANGVGAGHFFVYDATGGSYRMFINGTSGNVGMGNDNTKTTVPKLKLDINTPSSNDGIRVTQTGTTAATLSLTGGSTSGKRWAFHSTGTGNVQGAGHLLFWDWTTNVERMRINQNGFVGINTANPTIGTQPTHLFHVKSNTVNGANVDPVRIETLNAATDNNVVTVDATGVLHTRSIASLPGAGITNSCATINQVPRVIDALGNLACGSIYDNGNVGIGTTNPLHKVHIDNGALMLSGAVPGFGGPQLLFTDNLTTNPNGRWAMEYLSTATGRPSGGLNFWTPFPGGAAGNYSLFLKDDGKVGMGVSDDTGDPNYSATAFAGNYRLYVKGGILTDKVKVAVYNTTNWADYVFSPEYKLKSLDEVEAFTKVNKHLPGMQSASELVKDGGIDVSQMFAKQMEKIEELTLYMIEMKKEIKALKTENAGLKSSIVSPSKN